LANKLVAEDRVNKENQCKEQEGLRKKRVEMQNEKLEQDRARQLKEIQQKESLKGKLEQQ